MAGTWIPHLRLSFGGTLGASVQEIWSNTVKWNVLAGEPNSEQLNLAAAASVAPLRKWLTAFDTKISNEVLLTWVKLNWITVAGTQRDQDTVIEDVLPPARGAFAGQAPPYYQTQALTFRTRLSRGRGHSGRIYPPMVGFQSVAGTPYSAPADATKMAENFALCLTELRTAMGAVWQDSGVSVPDPAVFSVSTTSPKVQAPKMTLITGVVVDRVPDVQHRRTNRVARAEGSVAPI